MKIFIRTISFQNSNIRRLLKVNRNNKINQCYLLSSILRIGSCLKQKGLFVFRPSSQDQKGPSDTNK